MYVTLELVKLIQCLYLSADRHMYDAGSDTPFQYKTTTLNEVSCTHGLGFPYITLCAWSTIQVSRRCMQNLGQVEYVLSDKTGAAI